MPIADCINDFINYFTTSTDTHLLAYREQVLASKIVMFAIQ